MSFIVFPLTSPPKNLNLVTCLLASLSLFSEQKWVLAQTEICNLNFGVDTTDFSEQNMGEFHYNNKPKEFGLNSY